MREAHLIDEPPGRRKVKQLGLVTALAFLSCRVLLGLGKADISFEEKLLAKVPPDVVPLVAFFNPTGRQVVFYAYPVGLSGWSALDKQFIVIGETRGRYRIGDPGLVAFSQNGHRFAYTAKDGDKHFVVVNEKALKSYDQVDGPVFDPDGKRLMYAARKGTQWFIVIDGKEKEKFDEVSGWGFSPDNKRIAYTAKKDGQNFAVIDGTKEQTFKKVGTIRFSPDSQHIVYSAMKAEKWFLVSDGKQGENFDQVLGPVFAPDSMRVAYMAKKREKWFLVESNKKLQIDGTPGRITFSPDGEKVAYTIYRDRKCFLMINGKEEGSSDDIRDVVFSPDSSRLVYVAEEKISPQNSQYREFLVINGKKLEPFDQAGALGTPIFSYDSRRLAYGAMKRNELWWKVAAVE